MRPTSIPLLVTGSDNATLNCNIGLMIDQVSRKYIVNGVEGIKLVALNLKVCLEHEITQSCIL